MQLENTVQGFLRNSQAYIKNKMIIIFKMFILFCFATQVNIRMRTKTKEKMEETMTTRPQKIMKPMLIGFPVAYIL